MDIMNKQEYFKPLVTELSSSFTNASKGSDAEEGVGGGNMSMNKPTIS